MIIFFPMLTISCVCLYTLPERFSDLVCTLHSPPLSAVCCPPITGLSRPVLAAVPSPDSHIFHLHNTLGIYITTQTCNQVSSASREGTNFGFKNNTILIRNLDSGPLSLGLKPCQAE